jgi:hypothetical protein
MNFKEIDKTKLIKYSESLPNVFHPNEATSSLKMGIKGVWKALLPKTPAATSQPLNPNKRHFYDHLLIDLNPLLHRFAPFHSTNEALISGLDSHLKYLFSKTIHPVSDL